MAWFFYVKETIDIILYIYEETKLLVTAITQDRRIYTVHGENSDESSQTTAIFYNPS